MRIEMEKFNLEQTVKEQKAKWHVLLLRMAQNWIPQNFE